MSEMIQRIPPNNIEAEQSVLGAMLLDKEAISTATEFITGDDFYREAHKEIFEAIVDIYNRGEPVDLITLTEKLKTRNTLEAVGGITFLTNLMDAVPTTHNVKYYAKIVEDKSLLRKLIKSSNEIIQKSYQAEEDIGEIIDDAEKGIFNISLNRSTQGFVHLKNILNANFDRIEQLYLNKGKITGVPTGFHDLDNKLSGLQKSDLILIAARPSMGKSSFMMNIVQHAAVREKITTAIFSLEMSKEQLTQRLLCSEALIDAHRLRIGDINEDEWVKLARAMGPLSEAPIYIDDTPSISITEMRAKCRRLKLEHDLGLIVIDYLQLMQGKGNAESRQQEISEISRSLKALAREINVPVVALSQLSRAPEMRADHKPVLSDLRESGAIEQDADVVMFLYRDEYYHPDTEKKNIGEVNIAKQRNGPTGTVELIWLGQFTKFVNKEKHITAI
ncbi:MAG TPA: replicative DNA helicase [Bacillota bacterium]|nr:replicative DNA helicase [Bacillota bacterium]HQE66623.1 replicative DNA helicase [Bacillota bacterium]HQI16664.1 replicative DNA helicase [Bacillota bacterium]HQJ37774.1 replicative DNA helicase [Bacillota bacterium]HQL36224.1 replicative DNA helicase [Bacillota bacterium]